MAASMAYTLDMESLMQSLVCTHDSSWSYRLSLVRAHIRRFTNVLTVAGVALFGGGGSPAEGAAAEQPLTAFCRLTSGPLAGSTINLGQYGLGRVRSGAACGDGRGSAGFGVRPVTAAPAPAPPAPPPPPPPPPGSIGAVPAPARPAPIVIAPAPPPVDSKTGPSQRRVRASRVYAGPTQYPPESFAAYGIVAFPAKATPSDRDRHLMICNAYISRLPSVGELQTVPVSEQMVTVWPADNDLRADSLNSLPSSQTCEAAVDHYGLVTAQQGLIDAKLSMPYGRGPFLIAWSPGSGMRRPNSAVLVVDMSDVLTPEDARWNFAKWAEEIEADPSRWTQGWSAETLRLALQRFVDRYGTSIAKLLPGG